MPFIMNRLSEENQWLNESNKVQKYKDK